MKKLDKLIESTVKAMTSLKEYTDQDFSGAELIRDVMAKKPDSEDMEFIIEYFPNAVKSMSTAQGNLKASDASPMKKRMGRYAPMFVHVQYNEFEGDAGQTFAVHQKQYYNSNFEDKPGGEKFNPRVTKLTFFGGEDQNDEMGVILAVTDEYIKDLKDLKRQGKLGKRVSESVLNENKGQDAATELIAKLRRTLYPKLSDLELDAFKNEMAQHLDATMNENNMNTKTESIVNRLKEDTEYQKFFKSAMDKFGVKSPKGLSDKKKKEFFNYVDKNYKAKGE